MDAAQDTAYVIARVRADEALLPPGERLFEDPFAALFPPPDEAREGVERFLAFEYVREYIRLRTRYIDDFVRGALREGVRQLVILGAGFDCRAVRMGEIPAAGALAFEVDVPGQIVRKRAALAAAGVATPAHVRDASFDFAEAGFADRLRTELDRLGFRSGEPAAFITEGVVPYLDDASVARTFGFVAAACRAPRLVVDYHVRRFESRDLADRLRAAGFERIDDTGVDALHREHIGGEAPEAAPAFRLAVARREAGR